MAFFGSDATHGTVPRPPALHRGRVSAGLAEDSGAVVCRTGAGGVTDAGAIAGDEAGDPVRGEGVAGDGVEEQGCAPIGEVPAPAPASRSDTSFSGTGAEPLGNVRSSQYTVPGSIRSVIAGLNPKARTAFARFSARS